MVLLLDELVLHEFHQLVSKSEEDVKRERDHAIVQEGENGGGHYALEPAAGPLRPLSRGLTRRSCEIERIQQRVVAG